MCFGLIFASRFYRLLLHRSLNTFLVTVYFRGPQVYKLHDYYVFYPPTKIDLLIDLLTEDMNCYCVI